MTIQQLRVQGQQRFVEKVTQATHRIAAILCSTVTDCPTSQLLMMFALIYVFVCQSAALKRALSAHKQATTVNSHQGEWRQEHTRLTLSRQQAEADLLSSLQELSTSAYSQHFHSAHVNVHQLAADITAILDDRRQAEQSRDEWSTQMTQPRERARAMIAEARSKAQQPERSTRLAAQQLAADRTALHTNLRQLMHGLRHQCTVYGDELEQQRSEVEADVAEYNSDWLARMSDDRIEEDTASPDALLAVNQHWISSLPTDRSEELEAARRQWSDRWLERRDMMERLFKHKRDHARQLLDEHVTGLKRFGSNFDAMLTEEQIDDNQQQPTTTHPNPATTTSNPTTPATTNHSTPPPPKRTSKSAATRSTRTVRHPWNACDQRLLLHILTQYTAAGKQRKQTLDRLTLEFKHITGAELKLRLDTAIQHRLHSEQLRSINSDERVARWELDEAVESGWAAEVGRLKDEWRRVDEAKEREREAGERRADLQQLRAVRDEENRVKLEAKQLQDQAQAEKDRQAEDEERLRREEVKQQLAQYEEQQREQQQKVQRIIAVEQQREEEEKDELRHIHATRVAARQLVDEDKHRQQQFEAERLVQEQRDRERRLEALRQSVAPHVVVDRQRVQAPTVSSQAERDVDGRLFRVDGWSNEAVFSDPRAKLSAALHAAGISVSGDYAREVISTMGAGREARRDMKSTAPVVGSDAAG